MAYGPLPDGFDWTDPRGRTWTVEGDGVALWDAPTLTLLGDNPQEVNQGAIYEELGATAADCTGLDITGDIIIDSSEVDTSVPDPYTVYYSVTDSQGVTVEDTRSVVVIDLNQPTIRGEMQTLIKAGLPDGVQVYALPAEQVKAPAVVIGSTSWTPATQNSLRAVNWTVTLKLVSWRSMPEYNVTTLETLSVRVAQALAVGGVRVVGFETTGTETIGGTEYLTGNLEVTLRTEKN